MKKIKSLKWSVKLSYRNTFVFRSLDDAKDFMLTAVLYSEDPEDVLNFRLIPYVEYEEEVQPIYCDTDSLKEADKMKIKQIMNEHYVVVSSDKEDSKDAGDANSQCNI